MDSRYFALPDAYFDPAAPIAFDQEKYVWSLSTYDDVLRLLTDRASFSSDLGISPDDLRNLNPAYAGMWLTDGQRHDDLRAVVAEPFRPAVLREMEPRIREMTRELLDAADGDRIDIAALTRKLPSQVMCLILDVEQEAADRIVAWIDEVAHVNSIMSFPPQLDVAEYLTGLLNRRKADPGSGLLGELITAQGNGYLAGGRELSDWDLVGYLAMLLMAGIDTTSAGMANSLLFLTEYGHGEQLAAEPKGIPAAIDEALRWYPPFPVATRMAIQDVSFGDVTIPAGTPVGARLSAANRDPAHFTDPDTFDITRSPNPHLSYGRGAHYCLGAPLAKIETTILLEEMLTRWPRLRWDRDVPLERYAGIVHRLTKAVFCTES